MSNRDAFLRALAENEDDTVTRLVYADWLDEQGEPEEADRQRRWPASKEWLVRFCQEHNRAPNLTDEWVITYEILVEIAWEGIARAEEDGDEVWVHCMNNLTMCSALHQHRREFWKHWSIVTGIAVPSGVEEKGEFSCGC